MKVKNKLILLSVFSSTLLADITIDSLGIGYSKAISDYKQENKVNSVDLGNKPDKNYDSFEIFSTYKNVFENNTLKPYLSYSYSLNDEFKHQYLLFGVNKYYKQNSFDIYAGLLGGFGQLKWDYNPVGARNVDSKASSFILGLQAGVDFPLTNKWSLGVNTKYLIHDYETKIEPNNTSKALITHDDTITLGLNLSYKFFENKKKIINNNKNKYIVKEEQKPLASKENKSNTTNKLDYLNNKLIEKENIHFSKNSYKLNKSENKKVNHIASLLASYPKYKLEISAFTDSDGNEKYNKELSLKRAKSLYNRLIMMGINKNRLSYKAYGEKKALNSNKTKEEKLLNRRIEVSIF